MTATRICGNDETHVETETVNATGTITTPATCTAMGKTTYTSAAFENGAFEQQTKVLEDVEALGHDWDYGNATFNWRGYGCANATVTCKNDETHKLTVDVEVTSVTTAATCEADGSTVYTATFTADGRGYTDTKTEVLPKLNHAWSEPTYVWADDNSAVTATRTCGNDETHVETETVAVTSEVTTPATCEAKGKTTYTSAAFENEAFAKQTKVLEDVDALGHDWDYANATFNWTATGYGCANATVTCKNDETHKLTVNVEVTSVTTPAACEAAGETVYTAKFTADDRDYTDTKTETLAATGHRFPLTSFTAKAATCIETGLKAYFKCEACGKYFEDSAAATEITENVETWKVTEALGHDPADPVTENNAAPTCTEAGSYDKVVYCKRCGEELSRETVTVDALGHLSGPAVRENETAATCLTEGGYDTVTYCRRCEAELSREHTVIPALGHTYTKQVVSDATRKSAATCTEPAVYYYTCARCEEAVADTDAFTFIFGTPLGHVIETIEAAPATCVADGNNRYYHCTRCNGYFSDENAQNATTVADQTIPMDENAHDWGAWTVTMPATCSSEGEETRVCSRSADHKETRPVAVDPNAHKAVIVEGQEPTCTEAGWAGKEICELCGVTLHEHEPVPALGHDPEAIPGKAQTCTEDGWDEDGVKCARCGETLTESTWLPKLGHRYGAWTEYDGEQHVRICANNGEHKQYEAHDWDNGVATAVATCSNVGVKLYTCRVCGATKETEIPATGNHKWVNAQPVAGSRTHVFTCEGCGTASAAEACDFYSAITAWPTLEAPGVKTFTCKVCGNTYTEDLPATGITLSRTAVTVKAGETVSVQAYLQPGSADVTAAAQWTSADENAATVSGGTITGVGAGSAVVTVSAGGFSQSMVVTVTGGAQPAEYLLVTTAWDGVPQSTTNVVGTVIALNATLMPANTDPGLVEWYSSNANVASVDRNGYVTYEGVGTAIIYARTADGGAKGSITVRGTLDPSEVHTETPTFSIHYVVTDSAYVIKGNTINGNITVTYPAGTNVSFGVKSNVYVLINGVRQAKSADGTYLIENLDRNYTIMTSASENAGLDDNTGNNGGNGGSTVTDNGNGVNGQVGPCPYCGNYHTGFFGALVGFFHRIFYFFKTMFGKA